MTAYARDLINGLGRDLADGEAFTSSDGCTWTRYGDELAVCDAWQGESAGSKAPG